MDFLEEIKTDNNLFRINQDLTKSIITNDLKKDGFICYSALDDMELKVLASILTTAKNRLFIDNKIIVSFTDFAKNINQNIDNKSVLEVWKNAVIGLENKIWFAEKTDGKEINFWHAIKIEGIRGEIQEIKNNRVVNLNIKSGTIKFIIQLHPYLTQNKKNFEPYYLINAVKFTKKGVPPLYKVIYLYIIKHQTDKQCDIININLCSFFEDLKYKDLHKNAKRYFINFIKSLNFLLSENIIKNYQIFGVNGRSLKITPKTKVIPKDFRGIKNINFSLYLI